MRKRTVRLVTTTVLALSVMLAMAGPAAAASRTALCSTKGGPIPSTYRARIVTYYHYDGVHDWIDYYEYAIDGDAATTKNDIRIQQKRDKNNDIDEVYYSWSNGAQRADNRDRRHYPTRAVKIPGSHNTYTITRFIFDIPRFNDPRCEARTPNW